MIMRRLHKAFGADVDAGERVSLRGLAHWSIVALGYQIRPYDPKADERRWVWRRPVPCSVLHAVPTGDHMGDVVRAVEAYAAAEIRRTEFASPWQPWTRCTARASLRDYEPADAPHQRCRLRRRHLGRHAVPHGYSVRFFDAPTEGTP